MLGVGGIAEDGPANGAVTETYIAKLVDGLSELRVVFCGDTVVDGDADRAVGGLFFYAGDGYDLRCWSFPLVGCEVGGRALQDVEAADDGVGQGKAAC